MDGAGNMLQQKIEQIRVLAEQQGDSPTYAPLLKVVRVECLIMWKDGIFLSCPNGVDNPCYVTRPWEGMPKGALAGALMIACDGEGGYDGLPFPLSIWEADDPDLAACDAVIGMLEDRDK